MDKIDKTMKLANILGIQKLSDNAAEKCAGGVHRPNELVGEASSIRFEDGFVITETSATFRLPNGEIISSGASSIAPASS